jgi:hypothetical protein
MHPCVLTRRSAFAAVALLALPAGAMAQTQELDLLGFRPGMLEPEARATAGLLPGRHVSRDERLVLQGHDLGLMQVTILGNDPSGATEEITLGFSGVPREEKLTLITRSVRPPEGLGAGSTEDDFIAAATEKFHLAAEQSANLRKEGSLTLIWHNGAEQALTRAESNKAFDGFRNYVAGYYKFYAPMNAAVRQAPQNNPRLQADMAALVSSYEEIVKTFAPAFERYLIISYAMTEPDRKWVRQYHMTLADQSLRLEQERLRVAHVTAALQASGVQSVKPRL